MSIPSPGHTLLTTWLYTFRSFSSPTHVLQTLAILNARPDPIQLVPRPRPTWLLTTPTSLNSPHHTSPFSISYFLSGHTNLVSWLNLSHPLANLTQPPRPYLIISWPHLTHLLATPKPPSSHTPLTRTKAQWPEHRRFSQRQ